MKVKRKSDGAVVYESEKGFSLKGWDQETQTYYGNNVKVRRVGGSSSSGNDRCKHCCRQKALDRQQSSINAGKPIDHKTGTFGAAVATAAHGIGSDDAALQCPTGECGQNGQTVVDLGTYR